MKPRLASAAVPWIAGAAAALLAAGCATTQLGYKPSLSEVDVRTDHSIDVQTLVSLVPVPEDAASGQKAGLEARLRVQNHTGSPVRVVPSSLELVGANLASIPMSEVSPAAGLEVAPGAQATLSARFPYPPEEGPDSDALQAVLLHWKVDVGAKDYPHSLTFQRRQPNVTYVYYPGPYMWGDWGPGWYGPGWGPTVVIRERDLDGPREEMHEGAHDRG